MRLKDWYRATETEAEHELRRKLRRMAIIEWIGLAVLTPLSILLFWLYLVATPDWPITYRPSNLEEAGAEARHPNMEAMP